MIVIFGLFAAVCQAKMKMKKQEVATAISKACADARAVAKRKNCKDGADVNGKFFGGYN